MITEIIAALPWGVVVIVFLGMALLQARVIDALDRALGRQQATAPVLPAPPPAPPPIVDAPRAVPPILKAPSAADQAAPVVDPGLIAAVAKLEGFSAKAYPDGKQWSIGYGTRANSKTEVIDEAEGMRRLQVELSAAEQEVEAVAPTAPKGVKQALASLTYNAGSAWVHAGLGDAIRAGDYQGAKTHFLLYFHATGQPQAEEGLKARRETEVSWFFNPV